MDFRLWRHNGLCLNSGVCRILAVWLWSHRLHSLRSSVLSGPQSLEPSALCPLNLSSLHFLPHCGARDEDEQHNQHTEHHTTIKTNEVLQDLCLMERVACLSTTDVPWVRSEEGP